MKNLVFLLEERSAVEMLKGILPQIISDEIKTSFLCFQGKQDLERNLVRKLRSWLLSDSVFVVMRDQDAGDCFEIKAKLSALCQEAGKEKVLIRVACRELESFYLGDLTAVEKGLGLSEISFNQRKKKFRNPDILVNPARELSVLTSGAYQKISGSRAIAPYLSFENNCSHSFKSLISGLMRIVKEN